MKDLKEGIASLFEEAQNTGTRHLDPELTLGEGMRANKKSDQAPKLSKVHQDSHRGPKGK